MLHLLQGGYKGLELGWGVLHEQQARQGVVEEAARAAVALLVQEAEVLGAVIGQDEGHRLQLEQQLAAHVAGSQILPGATHTHTAHTHSGAGLGT